MSTTERWLKFERSATGRLTLFVVGCVIVVVSPIIGAIPGPGGVFVFALGLGMMLKYSNWAKRRYVDFKRRWPRHGRWADWGLRRRSARRRDALAKRESD